MIHKKQSSVHAGRPELHTPSAAGKQRMPKNHQALILEQTFAV
jgi:hypothetical protein